MNANEQRQFTAGVDCEVRFDDLTRQLFATDASIYQIVPMGVAFPRTAAQAASVIKAAVEAGVPVTPRGAGTGLAGGAVGDGLIVEMARHSRRILGLNLEKRTVRVGAGVVLDQLNAFLKPHGLCFGPDVATSSRATLGGMIANNSSGARAPVYGTTDAHVVAIEAVFADGRVEVIGPDHPALAPERERIDTIVGPRAAAVRERFSKGLVKRWPGYGLDRYLDHPGDLTRILTGSEGTLAAIASAELRLSEPPRQKGLGLLFFDSVMDAMRTTVDLLDLHPAAIEHIDSFIIDQTRGQLAFQAARAFLDLDDKPCEAMLIVEFYEGVADRLAEFMRRKLGVRRKITCDPAEMEMVWNLRKSGLSLMTGRKGPAKPVAGLEDVAVLPQRLPDYISAVKEAITPLGFGTSFYGHAASGLVHMRPVVDLHQAADIARFRELAEAVSRITRQFHGSLAGEHGVGIARTEFMEEQGGPELLGVMREIKALFDPKGLLNPGKIFPGGDYRIDTHLRWGAGYEIKLPFEPALAFASKDESFVANLEQCNGCGGCRKDEPTMCPTFIATGDEIMSTRGRANTIRAILDGRLADPNDPLNWDTLKQALDYCLSCKACKKECPSNVDLALLKAELLHAHMRRNGVPLLERFVSRFDLLGELGCIAPGIANAVLALAPVRALMERVLGLASQRPLPRYASQRFDHWFRKHPRPDQAPRGRIYLWDDCSVRYHEPRIGIAAVRVLEAAGYEVVLMNGHACCGRPAFSVGRLDVARDFAEKNVRLFQNDDGDAPIIFLEPSCYSMFAGDYEELGIKNAKDVARRCLLFEQFIHNLLEAEPDALSFVPREQRVAIHGHCHAKALTNPKIMPKLAARVPMSQVQWLETGCCGMAGSFGAIRDKYELSVQVAGPLVKMIEALEPGTLLVASGTSCRQQIEHLTAMKPLHMAELLARALP